MALDLATLDTAALCEEGAELELTHPKTGEGLGVFITVAGIDSKKWRRALNAIGEKRANKRSKLTAEEGIAGAVDILARCTIAWRNVTLDGAELPCTEENARTLYTRLPWVREQVDTFASDRGSYLQD